MNQIDTPPGKRSKIDIFHILSTLLTPIAIAITGGYATHSFNEKELQVSIINSKAQQSIARNSEMSKLIPNLGSSDENISKYSAVSLGLYGEHALPALLIASGDDRQSVRNAAVEALKVIGGPAHKKLEKVFLDKRNELNVRAMAIYSLGAMHAPNTLALAKQALKDSDEEPVVKKDAAIALGFIRTNDREAIQLLLSELKIYKKSFPVGAENIVFTLGMTGEKSVAKEISELLSHPTPSVRSYAIWAMARLGDSKTIRLLQTVAESDQNDSIRSTASDAIKWMRQKGYE